MIRNLLLILPILLISCEYLPKINRKYKNESPARRFFFETKNGVNTDVVIIKKGNDILLEQYDRGYTAENKHLSWSMAKSIAGILVSQAIEQGYFNINDFAKSIIPEFEGNALVKDFIQMSSGIKFKEIYTGIPVTADVTKMLYLEGPKVGFGNYAINLPQRDQASGTHFYYSSGDTNVLMEILRRRMPEDLYRVFPWVNLFDPLEIDVTFEQDAWERFVGSSYIYMKPADYLKIGELLIGNGVWNTEQIIPLWYMKMMKTLAPGVEINSLNPASSARAYSAQITTNLPIDARNLSSEYEYLPKDTLILLGHQGQILAVSPSEKLIILRLATDKGGSLNKKEFFKNVYEYLLNENNIKLKTTDEFQVSDNIQKLERAEKENVSLSEYLKVPKLITALAAKEFCSCYFIVKRSFADCRKDLGITLPIVPLISVNEDQVKGFMHLASSSVAEFRGEKLGCYLKAD